MEEKLKTLQATPFNGAESKAKYVLTNFVEGNQPFAVLVENDNNRMNTGKSWKFGVAVSDNLKKSSKDKGLYWFFGGRIYARDRRKAKEVYALLNKYCEDNELGQAFAYKVRTK